MTLGGQMTHPTRAPAYILALLVAGSGCIPDARLIVLASPTTRSCSLGGIASQIGPTPSVAPTPLDTLAIDWSTYEDDRFGYSFEYPAVYGRPPNSTCALTVVNPISRHGQEVYVGSAAAIFVKVPQHPSWRDDACLLILDLSDLGQLTSLDEVTFAGEDALSVRFSADWNPEGRQVILAHEGFLYSIANIANAKCDIPGTQITGDAVYRHLLATFRFITP